MRALWVAAVIGLSVVGPLGSASAQRFDERDRGFRERDVRDSDFRERRRDRDFDDRRFDDRGRGRGDSRDDRRAGFDEREYLRCHPDVRRAVQNGQMASGSVHYQVHGRREGRRLSC